MAEENEIKRAVAVINMAIKHNMFSRGTMPESDVDKVDEAAKLVAMCTQAKSIVDAVGASKVPAWPAIRDILIEAEIMVADDATQAGMEQPPSPPQTSSPVSPPPPPLPVVSPPVPATSVSATTVAPSTVSAASSSSPSPSSAQPTPEQPGGWLYGPQPGETWSSMGAGEWVPLKLLEGGQVEARSVATGESTVLPAGFLKDKIKDVPGVTSAVVPVVPQSPGDVPVVTPAVTQTPSVTPVVIERIELKVLPEQNIMLFTHPGCTTWMIPLDGAPLPELLTREECNECGMPFPLTSIDDGGYVYSPPPPSPVLKEEPSSELQQHPSSSAVSSPEAPVSSVITPETDSSTAQSSEPPSVPSQSVPTTGAPVDDDEGDSRYAALLDGVDKDFTPQHFPIPHDLESPPSLMPEDLTLGEVENRRLHSQYNALSARARYLWQIEHAKSKRCDRVVKTHMRAAMRAARSELGKDATVAEVRLRAEEQEDVATWIQRRDKHSDSAEAYETFFQIYAENVKTLSRDLTYAGTEQEGS